MIIYPAIDLKDGRCVRLRQGSFSDVTVYSDNPIDMAHQWVNEGAQYLHLVDLDGARTGEMKNLSIASGIAKELNIPVQIGGGIRSIDTIKKILDAGITRVILGTSAVQNPDLVKLAVREYGAAIAIGIDAKDGYVAIHGWEETSSFTAVDFALKMQDVGVKTIIYTDISRDGMLIGPNLIAMHEMSTALDIDVIASGGVARLQDILDLEHTGVSGVIVGKALYTGDVILSEAIRRQVC